jgi:Ni/Fe-hydrogenase 1 B-type cytochrome subunit
MTDTQAPAKHIIEVSETREDVSVRVWQVPIRIIHWTIFLDTALLTITGIYIGRPFLLVGSDPDFVMGWMRVLHQAGAWIFVAAFIGRMFLMFTGNQYARWDQFLPVRGRLSEGKESLKYYLFIRRRPLPFAGHNPLAGMAYAAVFFMFLVQIFTGFALRDLAAPDWLFQVLGGWMLGFFQPQTIRWIHHIIMWLTWGFVVHHVYSSILMEWEERSGLISSMISGRKRIPRDRL